MRKNNAPAGLLLLAASLAGAGETLPDSIRTAATPLPAHNAEPMVTVGQLESIQARNMLLAAQVQSAQLRRQLRESEKTVADPVPGIAITAAAPDNGASADGMPDSVTGLRLRLQEIYGRGKTLRARVRLGQGSVVEVVNGDAIPGSRLTVRQITDSRVTLSDGSALTF